jgi:hypothetical protein
VRCRFKRSGAARQVQARNKAKQQQWMEEVKIRIASKAEWKLKKREVELKAAAARVTELELHKAVHNQWASGAGQQLLHCQLQCFQQRHAREEAERRVEAHRMLHASRGALAMQGPEHGGWRGRKIQLASASAAPTARGQAMVRAAASMREQHVA